MLDVEFSHHGNHCTFETSIDRFAIRDRAAQRLAELIHDADLEGDKLPSDRLRRHPGGSRCGAKSGRLFGLHVIFPSPGTVDSFAILAGIVAFAGMVRWKWDIVPVVLIPGFAGLIFKMFLSHLVK
jgi:Chromate resistance exported protein